MPDAGEALVATFEEQLAAGQAVADDGVARSGRPLVLALYLRGDSVQLVFGAGSGIDAVVEAAGGINAGTELGIVDNAELSTESIVAAEPDFLLVTTSGLESVGGVDGLARPIPGIAETPAAEAGDVICSRTSSSTASAPAPASSSPTSPNAPSHPDHQPARTTGTHPCRRNPACAICAVLAAGPLATLHRRRRRASPNAPADDVRIGGRQSSPTRPTVGDALASSDPS